MIRRFLRNFIAGGSITLVSTLLAVFALNALATAWLRGHPEFLMSQADRVNENTRAIREAMITPDRAREWYALDSADEVKPMWDEFYRAGAEFESYVHFRSRPLDGRYYGTTPAGYRRVHENGPWPIAPANFNVFFFGGSTSFGVGPYWASVASYLQSALNGTGTIGKPVKVYNFGRSGYQSSQEVILLGRLVAAGHRPDLVVFLDGLNDFCFHDGQPSSWQTLATHFNETNDRYRQSVAGYGILTDWHQLAGFVRSMPITRLTGAWVDRLTAQPIPEYRAPSAAAPDTPEPDATLRSVIDRYLGNMRQVQAIAHAERFGAVFVWQPIPTYEYDTRHHVFNPDRLGCHVNSKYGYPMMRERGAADMLGAGFVWAADIQQSVKEPLYVDAFHYTAPMAKRLAEFVAAAIRERSLAVQAPR